MKFEIIFTYWKNAAGVSYGFRFKVKDVTSVWMLVNTQYISIFL